MNWEKIKDAMSNIHKSEAGTYSLSFGNIELITEQWPKIQRFIDAVRAADKIDLHTSDSDEQRIMQERVEAERELLGD